MSLHDDWAAAKKQAWKDFKEAQKNYLKAQDKKINATNDPKARKKALDVVLGESGLDQGESLDDYLKFADGFGKSLDALEKVIDKNAALHEKYNFNGDVDNVLKDKEAAKQFLIVCQATHCTNQITFYMRDYKKSPQEVYDQYVRPGTPDSIEFESDATLGNDWEQAVQNPETLRTQGKALVDRLRALVKHELDNSVLGKFERDATARKNLGFIPKATLDALKKEVRDTAQKYDGQVEQAVKKWKNLKPQFWVPLDETLQGIVKYVDSH